MAPARLQFRYYYARRREKITCEADNIGVIARRREKGRFVTQTEVAAQL